MFHVIYTFYCTCVVIIIIGASKITARIIARALYDNYARLNFVAVIFVRSVDIRVFLEESEARTCF